MEEVSGRVVDEWWSRQLGVEPGDLWRRPTVAAHTGLRDYPGWFVAWRHDGVHVSAPRSASDEDVAGLRGTPAETLATEAFWTSWADDRGLRVVGPAVHHYLDRDPGPSPLTVAPDRAEVTALRSRVTPEEWAESGVGDEPGPAFGVRVDGGLVAVAVLRELAGAPRDLAVLVTPAGRGRRLVDEVGRSAASYAVARHGLARWRSREGNTASMRAAARLGFLPWCTQLAVR